jgi:acetyl-CoA C-acetyltransferase
VRAVALDPRLPVIVGAGQVSQRVDDVDAALAPVPLMAEAVRLALADAGAVLPATVPSVRVVSSLSWRYRDPARFLAGELGVAAAETILTTSSGSMPQWLLNGTAAQVQRGELDLAVLAGGECWRTRMRARREGRRPPWPDVPESVQPDHVVGGDEPMSSEAEKAMGIVMPVQVYPMFETAIRAASGETVSAHQRRLGELWARFALVAATNPYAWVRRAPSAEEIIAPGPDNRMIGLPYPKLMNSNNDVDQAAAVIVCSAERARALGVATERWVFLHSGTATNEPIEVSTRDRFDVLPAVRLGGRRALELAGVGIDDVELIDLYSCFPSAVQLGAAALDLSLHRQLTRTGGLSFAGGPWNDYVMHAIATIVGELRAGVGQRAFVWANGGFATKHAFGVYAAEPSTDGFRGDAPIDPDPAPLRALAPPAAAAGPARVEAYTVMHDREGRPELALAACRLADGRRAWGRSAAVEVTSALGDGEWVGRDVSLNGEGTLHTSA